MTDSQFLVLLGTIWVAPFCNEWYAKTVGSIILLIAGLKGLNII